MTSQTRQPEPMGTEAVRPRHSWKQTTRVELMVGCLVAFLFCTASAKIVPSELNRSTLIVKLAPSAGKTGPITLGATGRPDVDQLLADLNVQQLHQVFRSLPASHRLSSLAARMRLNDYLTVKVPQGVDPGEMKKRLEALPGIEHVEYDVIVRIASAAVTPNDPYFLSHQYPLRNTGTQPPADPGTPGADLEMEAAWAHTTGDTNVVVGIVDTGIDFDHPDLMNRIWYNVDEGLDGIDEDSNGFASDWRGWNFADNNNNPDDDHSHGSHVAGIVGAEANNGIGITGMDWNCKLMAVKVLGANGSGSAASVAGGIEYAAANGADIISMSLGSFTATAIEADAIAFADSAGVTIFAASGNDNVSDTLYPAGYPQVIAVAATDSDDKRAHPFCGAPGSDYGDYIDICAPGDWVWSTVPIENGSYGYKCGTSMATPHASGLAALIKALRPNYTPSQIRTLMRAAAEDQVGRPGEDTPGFDIYHGWGRINGRITLQALTTDFAPIIAVPGPQTVTELDTLVFVVTATDSNFTMPSLSASPLPNAVFVDSGNGTGVFTLVPDILQQGTYSVLFTADDGALTDTDSVTVTVNDGCLCPRQGDYDEDGVITAVDLSTLIDVIFFSGSEVQDPGCPTSRGDATCDGMTDAVDLSAIIDYVFFSGQPPCDPCFP